MYQILSNPGRAAKSNLAGITHVITRMDWYYALTGHLLERNSTSNSLESVLIQLKPKVLDLYKAILLYQMKSVISYYKHQGVVFARALANLDNWDGDLEDVKTAEKVLLDDWKVYDQIMAQKLSERLIELTENMGKQLGDISETLRDFTDRQEKMRVADENRKYLDLFSVANPQDDMERIIGNKNEDLRDDVYKWIFEDKKYIAFTNWAQSNLPQCRLLWIKGPAGTGKTMLLMGIIRGLSNQSATFAQKLSYFFCESTNPDRNHATVIMKTLMWMLIIQQPHLIKHLQLDYEVTGKTLFTDINASIAVPRVFTKMLEHAEPVYFIIDALDECEQGLEKLIKLISTSLTHKNVRWLVSSRPDVNLLTELQKLNETRRDIIKTLDELNIQSQETRVEKYIEYKLSNLKKSNYVGETYTDETLAMVASKVHERAQNNFLWMHLIFKELEETDGKFAKQRIQDYPPGLSELYDYKITRIEKVRMKYQQYCWDFLMVISLARRLPLSLSELAPLVPLSPGTVPRLIIKECGSFLTIEEELVNVTHKSAKDYLENERLRLCGKAIIQGHADIVRCSIDAMSTLTKNIYHLEHQGIESKDITPPELDPLAPIQYFCVFWLDHLRDEIKESPENGNKLCNLGFGFLKKHFLHWLESLSLLHRFSDGITSIRKLLNVIQVSLQYLVTSTILSRDSHPPKRALSLSAS